MPPIESTKKRILPSVIPRKRTGTIEFWVPQRPNGTHVNTNTFVDTLPYLGGIQTTVSRGNPFTRISKTGLEDIGGPFETTKSYCRVDGYQHSFLDQGDVAFGAGRQYSKAVGTLLPRIFMQPPDSNGRQLPAFPPSARSSNDDLDEYGATAIARCSPTNPPVDAAQAIGELFREGLPHLVGSASWKARSDRARAAGSDYLNVQFGWRPLVSEISDFANVITNLDSVLAQYERDSGKVVRRRYEFPIERTSSTSIENTGPVLRAMAYPANFLTLSTAGPSTVLVSEKTEIRRWFSGAFTYYLPSGYESRTALGRLRLLADRVGLTPTPDLIWELSPWSWAVDWFSNTGDVITNVSRFATGGLVMHYGYIMEHSIRSRTYYQPGSGYQTGSGKSLSAGPLTLVTETKVRRQANPYGFGVSWDGLSTFQASILAALGISRRR